MSNFILAKRIAFSWVMISLMLLWSCGKDATPEDPAQLRHLTEVREQIKGELGDAYDLPVAPETKAQLERGGKLYARLCASCHGGRGNGNGRIANNLIAKPADFTDPQQATFFSEQARLYIIRKGIEGTPMMGWENVLTQNDIVAVYLYVRSLIGQK